VRLALSIETRKALGMESPWWYAPHVIPEKAKPTEARRPHGRK
jgi:hypothetical protein